VKKALTSLARSAFHAAGGTLATRLRNRNGVRILMYHRFPAQSALEQQCIHLMKYYRPVSLTEIGWWLRKKRDIPQQAVVFTVDDGYRDFFLNAFPVLSAYAIPAVVYLATDMIDQGSCLWVDWVRVLFQTTDRKEVGLDLPGKGLVSLSTSSNEEKERSARQVKEHLKTIPNADRVRFLGDLPGMLSLDHLPSVPEEYAPLRWDEIRNMAQRGIEFGAHTRSHPILARLETRDEVCYELAGSKARIEQELGSAVVHFCYPNGNLGDFTDQTVEVAQECGYLTAVTGLKGVNFQGADPFRLLRVHQEPWNTPIRFAQQVAGLAD
jgi:peptidoglycan/xylan/chitin deacetylase (PgdA/CDA1 family)